MFVRVRKYVAAAEPPIASCVPVPFGRLRSWASRHLGMRKLRPAAFTTTGRDIANRARSAGAASSSAVTGGVVISTESATAPDGRSSCPSVRTIVSAAASRSSRLPGCSGTTSMRRPWRTSLALRGWRSTSAEILSSTYSRAAFDTTSRGSTSAPKTRARSRRKPRTGPNPSPARPAAATAAFQSGWTASWFAANRYELVAAMKATGCGERCSNSESSFATASRFVRPPTSTPATRVPGASSLWEPANARPTRMARSAAAPAASASAAGIESERRRERRREA